MQYKQMENQIEFLLSAALQKCGNIEDARDLTQEALLAALSYLSRGNTIEDMRAWLLTVMNRRFYDMMRKKYRQPVISIGDDFDIIDEKDIISEITSTEEAESVRREIAYLAKMHREVIVRHYMNGESVAEIASALKIPEGTVKSRLYSGRTQMKKGIVNMENYTKQSYEPITLHVTNSGQWGLNGEPGSLVENDLMAHAWSGERWERFENYAGAEQIELHVYGAEGFPARSYNNAPDYNYFTFHEDFDAVLLRLLYIIHAGVDPNKVGFNTEALKAIPWLTECKVFRSENDKPVVNIPVLSKAEAKELWNICKETQNAMVSNLKDLLAAFFEGKRLPIPAHLDSVPLQKQYLYAGNALLFATIREALTRSRLYDGDYDNDKGGVNQPPCPMVLIIEK